ncbi:MAG TPA: saccharopine dehydrogenase NADP-binding domain-containing protein [Bacillota bacterium]|nr:saccharopine dehydrogenase NADP-binding domain-containing protein [Bacillota bacterium]
MKVLIVGAGGQGGACASILARQDCVEEIRLFDLDESVAKSAADQIGSGKVKAGTINATNSDDVARAAEGVDVVVDMVMPWMVPYVMEGALKAKANYINTAFDTPYWDEFLAGKKIEELTLSKEFEDAGLTALFGCGFAPGWTNVLARRFANRLDRVDSIKMRIGKATVIPGENPYSWALRPWNPGWSPKQALIDCASPTYALENGKYVQYPPFGGIDECEFPEPVGKLPITHHSHEEIYSMPATFPGVKDVDFKYYMMMQPAILNALGLCSQEEIEVNGVKVRPIDVVAAMVPKPANNVFAVSDEKLEEADRRDFIELIVEVSGVKDGQKVTWKANCPKMNAPGPALKKLYGTALVYVALPLAIGTMLIKEVEMEKGIIFVDQLDPEKFIERMMSTGYPYQWKETQI